MKLETAPWKSHTMPVQSHSAELALLIHPGILVKQYECQEAEGNPRMLASDGRQSTNETFDREDSEATTVAGRERMEVGKTASRGGDGSDQRIGTTGSARHARSVKHDRHRLGGGE